MRHHMHIKVIGLRWEQPLALPWWQDISCFFCWEFTSLLIMFIIMSASLVSLGSGGNWILNLSLVCADGGKGRGRNIGGRQGGHSLPAPPVPYVFPPPVLLCPSASWPSFSSLYCSPLQFNKTDQKNSNLRSTFHKRKNCVKEFRC